MSRERPEEGGLGAAVVRGIAIALSIGLPFGLLVSFGALAGQYLDEKTGKSVFAVSGVILGALGALANMLRIVSHLNRRDETKSREADR